MLDSDAPKACALPWKLVCSESGLPSCFSTCWMALTASPIAVPGSRLNEIVTDGNWPWWLTTSGATLTTLSTSVDSGTCWPARGVDVDVVQRFRPVLELRVDLQDDVVLVQGRVHGRDDALAEGVVERVVDGGGQDAVARGDIALDRDVEQGPGIELVGGDVGDAGDRLDLVEEQRRPVVELAGIGVVQRVLILGLVETRAADRDVLRGLHVERDALDLGEVGPQPRDHLVDAGRAACRA